MKKKRNLHSNDRLWHFSTSAFGLILITTIAIASVLFIVHQQRLGQLVARSQLVVETLFKEYDPGVTITHEFIDRRARQLLQIDGYVSAVLIDEFSTLKSEFGLPLNPADYTEQVQSKKMWEMGYRVFHVIPFDIQNGNTKDEKLWLITVFDKTYISLLNFQFLFVTALILLVFLGFALFYYRMLRHEIFRPLEKLNDIIDKQNKTQSISPVVFEGFGVLDKLVQKINEFISHQISKQMDYRASIEQATQELKESLETVEIHNIDLDLARKNAVELNKLKSEFLKKTSQDLRTPLGGILGFSELLRKTQLSRVQRDYVSTIEESTKGMLTIVSDIHDFSRLESGSLLVDKKPMELRRNIEDTLTMQAPIANERDVTLYSSVDVDVPAIVIGDPVRLQQVLANLVSNAIKFESSSYIEVCVHADPGNEDLMDLDIVVNTDGICPKELQDWQISDETRFESSRQFYSGAGIGFSIAKGIAQHMGGQISCTQAEGKCSFIFSIQLEQGSAEKTANKTIDPSYQINALVYSNNDFGYREVTSRLVELGIRNKRADSFSDILNIAQKLRDEASMHSRYMPLAIIEAQTSQQTLDKIMLTQTLETLVNEFKIPVVVISPMNQHESLQKILGGVDVFITQHPIITPRLRKGILEQLGIVKLKNENALTQPQTKATPIRILVVDDNKANLKLTRALLADVNAEITTAETGAEAIKNFEESAYELIFMDIQLPDMDGYEATKKMRLMENAGQRTPIVALTAHNVVEEKVRLLLAGMDDCIGKPIAPKDITTTIDRWVNTDNKLNSADVTKDRTNDKKNSAVDASPQSKSPVNISSCLELAKNDNELAKDMLAMLVESLPGERLHIRKHFDSGDMKSLYETIHRLHGACCYCGVPRLKMLCKKADTDLRNGSTDYLDREIEELLAAIDELIEWQKNHDIEALFSP